LARILLLRAKPIDLVRAENLIEEVLEARKRLLTKDTTDFLNPQMAPSEELTVTSRNGKENTGSSLTRHSILEKKATLGITLRQEGSLNQAEHLEREVLEVRMGLFGSLHAETLAAKNNLASTLQQRGDFTNARQLLFEIREAKAELLCAQNLDPLVAKGNLVNTLMLQKNYAAAESMQREILFEREDVLGKHHECSLSAHAALDVLLRDREQQREELARKVVPVVRAGICKAGGKLQLSHATSLPDLLKLRKNPLYAHEWETLSLPVILKKYSQGFHIFCKEETTLQERRSVIYIENIAAEE